MEADDYLMQQARERADSADGRAALSWGALTYTPEQERQIRRLAAYTNFKSDLQNADGSFKFAPQDDGSLLAGKFGIDSYGRFVTIP